MDESPPDLAKAVAAIGRIDSVPTLLEVLCETTGMRFAVVARVTGKTWTVCAVQDGIQLGVKTGGELALRTNLAIESQASRTPIVVEHASTDPRYRTNADQKTYRIESYISVPIFLPGGGYFGILCALDPRPIKVAG
ncbi:MAG TPA: GAF domain-containing protein, partial [Steroidobacteraceae bacterium]|nr:GAF domain-containing protein [Steroidobacteraceae bacterium]